jgi:hypothetical protein
MRRWLGIGFLHAAPIKVGTLFFPIVQLRFVLVTKATETPISNAKKGSGRILGGLIGPCGVPKGDVCCCSSGSRSGVTS